MRNLRRLGSALLVLVMCLALSVPAFAAEGTTLSIMDAKKGVTYNVYRMADLSVNASKDAYSYMLSSDEAKEWAEFWKNCDYVEVTGTDPVYVTWNKDSGVASNGSAMIQLAKDARDAVEGKTPVWTVTPETNGDVSHNLGSDGYYLVTSSLGFNSVMDTMQGENLKIYEKNVEPKIVQYISDYHYELGEDGSIIDGTIVDDTGRLKSVTAPLDHGYFTIVAIIDIPSMDWAAIEPAHLPAPLSDDDDDMTGPVSNGTGLTSLEATFVLDEGLSFVGVNTYSGENVGDTQNGGAPTRKIGVMHNYGDHYGEDANKPEFLIYGSNGANSVWDDQSKLFKVTETSNGFKVQFTEKFLNEYVGAGERIGLLYRVEFNGEKTKISNGDGFKKNTSVASIKYGDNNAITGNSSEVDFYTLSMPVYKFSKNDNTALAGAKFTLDNSWGDGVIPVKKIADGKYRVDSDGSDTIETDATGYAVIEGIGGEDYISWGKDADGIGTYVLTEIEAPAGYNKLDTALNVGINGKHESISYYPEHVDTGEDKLPNREGKVAFTIDGGEAATQVGVANVSGAKMPETGGSGTTMILVTGIVLVAMAGTGYAVYRRKDD